MRTAGSGRGEMRVVAVGTERWTGGPNVAVALSEGSGDHPDLGVWVGVVVTREAAGRGREEAGAREAEFGVGHV